MHGNAPSSMSSRQSTRSIACQIRTPKSVLRTLAQFVVRARLLTTVQRQTGDPATPVQRHEDESCADVFDSEIESGTRCVIIVDRGPMIDSFRLDLRSNLSIRSTKFARGSLHVWEEFAN